jgi:hypothetical protein
MANDDVNKKKSSKSSSSSGGDGMLWFIIILVFLFVAVFGFSREKPFDPNFINLEYFFSKVVPFFSALKDFIINGHTWSVIGTISSGFSIILIGVIIFSLVRMREIQLYEKREVEHEIKEALARDAEVERNENPRWRYIQTLLESPNESDWRIAVIESDTMLDEVLAERGYEGETISEKLKGTNFSTVQNAWDAHNVRNQIAHEGSDFPISQIEARRTVKMFQNVFEELNVV